MVLVLGLWMVLGLLLVLGWLFVLWLEVGVLLLVLVLGGSLFCGWKWECCHCWYWGCCSLRVGVYEWCCCPWYCPGTVKAGEQKQG